MKDKGKEKEDQSAHVYSGSAVHPEVYLPVIVENGIAGRESCKSLVITAAAQAR